MDIDVYSVCVCVCVSCRGCIRENIRDGCNCNELVMFKWLMKICLRM